VGYAHPCYGAAASARNAHCFAQFVPHVTRTLQVAMVELHVMAHLKARLPSTLMLQLSENVTI
jgi:hypothetical protein